MRCDFSAAGSRELTQACENIGYCPTGSAVITPGFKLNAKYIVHAVGPIWNGGKYNERDELFSAYTSSMERALESGCHSIGFPLISAGIFGYPVREAWKVAIEAVRTFQVDHADYTLDAVFAVIDDGIMKIGQEVLESESNNIAKSNNTDIILFHDPDKENGYLSNWYMSGFIKGGKKYCCAEQYMMEQKALLFGDTETAEKIMRTDAPDKMQKHGQNAANFNQELWDVNKQLIVYKALLEKFTQNYELAEKLLKTGSTLLIECAPSDIVWSCGLRIDDSRVNDRTKWKGQNLLGFTLMSVREELKLL